MTTETSIGAVNALAVRWAADVLDGRSLALAPPAVWPMLAALAAGADGAIRAALAAATGVDPAIGGAAARDLLDLLNDTDGVRAAFGIWSNRDLVTDPFWPDDLPPHTHGTLTGDAAADKAALDAWMSERTAGLLPVLPQGPQPDTEMLLIGTLLVQTAWRHAMSVTGVTPEGGPWDQFAGLRAPVDPADIAVTAGGLTRVIVRGAGAVDVHLVLGDAEPGAVVAGAISSLGDPPLWTAADAGPPPDGSAVRVGRIASTGTAPVHRLQAPPFTIRTVHDLLKRRALFGLPDAELAGAGSTVLKVDEATQYVMAQFDRSGFTAAAATLSMWVPAGFTREPHEVPLTEVVFDRPFGFVAVHRATGLALVAGWVASAGG
jgi:serine protease inhibitor